MASSSTQQLPPAALPDLPSIAALFLIDFDVKAGYTIVWKQAIAGLELEGVVEYKSLPSGLHTVSDDLIYFVHEDGYAGLSAFVNAPTDDEGSRHARMIAVGVLVPLSYGRLGRAWRHAEGLRAMAAALAADRKQTQLLEDYWRRCGTRDAAQPLEPIKDSPLASPALGKRTTPTAAAVKNNASGGDGHARNRSASDGAALMQPEHRLSPFHPAWSLTKLLATFGPLIFPIHRAALLRKRILISTHAPVNEACNFVYDISILANIPLSVFDMLEPSAPAQRLRPLFTIGVHDIPFLTADSANTTSVPKRPSPLGDSSSGWIACTTDSILAMKDDLWDVLITLPPAHTAQAQTKVWPTVESPKGVPMKATQRDLRRFRTLKAGLGRINAATAAAVTTTSAVADDAENGISSEPTTTTNNLRRQSRLSSTTSFKQSAFLSSSTSASSGADLADDIVEPMTWAALAYSGFMFWASAGEQRRSDEAEELAHDNGLLADLIPFAPSPAQQQSPPTQRRPSGSFNVTGAAAGMSDSLASLTARRVGTGMDGFLTTGTAATAAAAEGPAVADEGDAARAELGIITFFHRLTANILGTLAEVVAATAEAYDDDDDEETAAAAAQENNISRTQSEDYDEGERLLRGQGGRRSEDNDDAAAVVRVDSDALAAMGLDVWSQADAEFVREVVARYFARQARVDGKGVEVCGLRVC